MPFDVPGSSIHPFSVLVQEGLGEALKARAAFALACKGVPKLPLNSLSHRPFLELCCVCMPGRKIINDS
jgi:hypothetical protein